MPRIKVDPVQLRALNAQLQQAASDLQAIGGRIGGVMGSLDWEARQKAGVDAQVSDARGRANALAGQAEAMARYVAMKAQAFEEADRQGAADCRALGAAFSRALEKTGWTPRSVMRTVNEQARRLIRLGELLSPAAAATVIGVSMRGGIKYAGQAIINVPDWLGRFIGLRAIREAAGLSGHLNHFRYTSLPSHMLSIGLVTSVPVIVGKWATDIGGYLTGTSTGTRTASAMAVDAALTLAPVVTSFAVSQIVVWSGAALGTLLFPGVGMAAGYAVGVAATSLISGVAANVATQWAVEAVREQAIAWVDENIAKPVVQAVSTRIQQVDNGLRSVAHPILSGVRTIIHLPSLSR